MSIENYLVPIERLRRICPPEDLECTTTSDVSPLTEIIGQERAVRALRFGLGMKSSGYNIYVAGVPGTGKMTAVQEFLKEIAKDQPVPDDWCYVNNFDDPYHPKVLRLPAGRAHQLRADMQALITSTKREITKAFESEQYTTRREELISSLQERQQKIFSSTQSQAQKEGFVLQSSPAGLMIIPLVDGKPISDNDFAKLPPERQQEIRKRREQVEEQLRVAMKQAHSLEKETHKQLEELDHQVTLFAAGHLIDDIKQQYDGLADVQTYLQAVKEDIVAHAQDFRTTEAQKPPPQMQAPWAEESKWRKYEVNVLIDNSGNQGAPVITELNPTYTNLFGRIEKEAQFGALHTDFTLVKAGALHRALGGYMVLPVEDLLRNNFAYDGLKRTLRNREICIEDVAERLGFMSTKSIMPEPIPVDTKVVLVGSTSLYHLLYSRDEEFDELFKVKADFNTQMPHTSENEGLYVCFIALICEQQNLLPFDGTGVAKVIEYSSRLAADQDKLSTRFADIADILTEANYWAAQDGSDIVHAEHVSRALAEKVYRSNLVQEHIQEMIQRGQILIDTEGEKVGQVNGLSVINMGDFQFGQPSRITISLGLGRAGVVDIERKVDMGGRLHSKGVMILSGFFIDRYTQDYPLTLTARLVFEQSYGGVDGDSASSTELYALLSRLAELPIRQGLAVTGSVNQKGEVQAIGGVNDKIEGFFDVCKAKGLTGDQGVMIPASNVANLMLREDVLEAVRQGQFHIYAVSHVDQGIEILTGVPAGELQEDGSYTPDSVNDRVLKRLEEMGEKLRKSGRNEKDEDKEEKTENAENEASPEKVDDKAPEEEDREEEEKEKDDDADEEDAES